MHNVYIIQLQNVQYALITRKFFRSQTLLPARSRGTTRKSQLKKERDNLKTLKQSKKGQRNPKLPNASQQDMQLVIKSLQKYRFLM